MRKHPGLEVSDLDQNRIYVRILLLLKLSVAKMVESIYRYDRVGPRHRSVYGVMPSQDGVAPEGLDISTVMPSQDGIHAALES